MLEIKLATTSAQRQECYRLRHAVFVDEQNVPVSLEIDDHDETDAIHFLGEFNGEYISTARLVYSDSVAKVGRMVVHSEYRGCGYGAAIMQSIIHHATAMDEIAHLELDAQIEAKEFYEKLGFRPQGDIFMDAGIPHIHMTLKL